MGDPKQAACTGRLTATVSLLHNNLSYSPNGWLCAVHNSVNAGGKLLLHGLAANASKDGPVANQVTSIRYLSLAIGPVLCVTSTNGSQIYSEDATTLLFFAALNEPAVGAESLKRHQGACVVEHTQHVVVGTSKGTLVPVHAVAVNQFVGLPEAAPSGATTEVADVCYCRATQSAVSVHSNGDLRTWSVTADGQYTNVAAVQNCAQAPVRVASLGIRLLVADGPGTIRLFDAATCALQAAIAAHARCITAIDVREETGSVLSVGEDTVLNVWQVDHASGEVGLAHSSVVTDKLLTGASFAGAGVAITAYDSDELFYLPL